jgi:EAL domain-containing protein (putative c-di-GMP-specific phosphodiesterase class I)
MSSRGGAGELHRLRAEFFRLKSALHDRNTDLSSFHVHFPELRSHFENLRSVGVVVVGLGELSQVEAIYGWQVFDRLLRRVGKELDGLRGGLLPHGCLLAVDGIAAGRFVLFVPRDGAGQEVSAAYLEGLVNSIRAHLDATFAGEDFRSMTPRLRFELGHSLLQDDPFFRFERQVYRAVGAARRASAGPFQRQRSRQEEELRRILREGEIQVVFQPIHSLESGEVLGYEALSRGPEGGAFRDPQVMFDTSRSVGLSTELDALCQRRAILGAHGLEPGRKLFVNALPSTLVDPAGGAELPVEWIDRAGLRRSDVVIEISERGPLVDRARVHEELARLREAGLGVALDDIGTGMTGVDAIEAMRPDYLKLDVSLVHNIHTNLITQELLRSLAKVARSMDARVVGEGVETEQEREALRRCGTDLAQGFLFARPGPDLPAGAEA